MSLASREIFVLSGNALRISKVFLAEMVTASSELSFSKATEVDIWISKSVAKTSNFWLPILSNTLDSIGNVCRRSTIPETNCRGLSNKSLSILSNFIFKSNSNNNVLVF